MDKKILDALGKLESGASKAYKLSTVNATSQKVMDSLFSEAHKILKGLKAKPGDDKGQKVLDAKLKSLRAEILKAERNLAMMKAELAKMEQSSAVYVKMAKLKK